jgi:hypothetical protein
VFILTSRIYLYHLICENKKVKERKREKKSNN